MVKPVITQLIVDASGAKTGVAEFERAMDKAKKAAKDGGESTNSFERAQRAWANSLAKADPAIRAQLQLQRDLERQQRINTEAVRLGITTQEAANAQLARVKRLHEERAEVLRRSTRETDHFSNSLQRMRGLLVSVGAVLGVREIVQYADAWTAAGNRIVAMGTPVEQQGTRLRQLADIAVETRTEFDATVASYARLQLATEGLGKSEEELLRIIQTVNTAFAVSGASASERAAGTMQLMQALSSGVLQGDELRSIRENAPLIAKAIADVFDTTVGGLKELGAEGKITADKMIEALTNIEDEVRDKLGKTSITVADSLTNLKTRFIEFVSVLSESGAMSIVASGINLIADNIEAFATSAAIIALPPLLSAIAWGIGAIGVAIAANPIGAIVVGAGLAATALYSLRDATIDLGDETVSLRDLLTGTWNVIESHTSAAMAAASEELSAFGEVAQSVWGKAIELGQTYVAVYSLLGNIVLDATGISAFFDSIAQAAREAREEREYWVRFDADMRRMVAGAPAGGGTPPGGGGQGNGGGGVDINAIEDYVSKLEEAARLTGLTVQQRELERALIEAANEAQKAVNREQRITVTTAEQARMLLDDSTEARIAAAVAEQQVAEEAAKLTQERQRQEQQAQEARTRAIEQGKEFITRLQQEARLAGLTAEQREIELAIIEARNLAQAAGLELTDKELEKVKYLVQQRQQAEASIKTDTVDKAAQAADEFGVIWDQASRNLQDSFSRTWRDIFDNGIGGAKGFGRSLLNIFKDIAAQIAALWTFQKLGLDSLFKNLSGGGSMVGGGGLSSLFGGGGGFSLAGIGKTLESGGGLLGLLGLGGGGSTAGLFSGAVKGGGATGLFGTGTSFMGALGGAGMGFGIGSANLFGGKQLGSTIGGTLGGIAGSFLGPIGTILGSAAGSFIGGLFGAGPSNYTAFADFNSDFSGFSSYGDKPNQNTTSMANAAGNAVLEATKVLRDAGIDFTSQIDRLGIGERDRSFVDINGKRTFVAGVGDVEGTVKAVLDMLLATATSTDESVKVVLDAYKAQGLTTANIDQLLSDIGFSQSLDDLIAANDVVSQWAQAIAEVNAQFGDAIERARDLGINVESLIAAQADALAQIEASFNATYGGSLDQITAQFSPSELDQYAQALQAVNAIYEEAAAEATALGYSLDQIEASANAARDAINAASAAEQAALARAAEFALVDDELTSMIRNATDFGREAERMAQSWAAAGSALRSASTALLVSDSALSPGARYSAAQAEFDRLRSSAIGGDVGAANDLARFASTFLQTSLDFNASSTAYGRDFQTVQDALSTTASLASLFQSEAEIQAQAAVDAVSQLEAIHASLNEGTIITVLRENVDIGRAIYAALTGASLAATSGSSGSSSSTQSASAAPTSSQNESALAQAIRENTAINAELLREMRMANLEKRHAVG